MAEEALKRLTVIDFCAPWCAPCKEMESKLQRLDAELQGRLIITRVNVEQDPELAARYGVRSLPTLIVLDDDTVLLSLTGDLSMDRLRAKISALL